MEYFYNISKGLYKNIEQQFNPLSYNSSIYKELVPELENGKNDHNKIRSLITPYSITYPNKDGKNALQIALSNNCNIEVIKLLITNETLLQQNYLSENVLMVAIKNRLDLTIIKLLINENSLKQYDIHNMNALFHALINFNRDNKRGENNENSRKIIELLSSYNIEEMFTQQEHKLKRNVLTYALNKKCDNNIIRLLIIPANILQKCKSGENALMCSLQENYDREIIELLVNDETVLAINKRGENILMTAIAWSSDADIVKLFINNKSILHRNKNGGNALMYSLSRGYKSDLVKLLATSETIPHKLSCLPLVEDGNGIKSILELLNAPRNINANHNTAEDLISFHPFFHMDSIGLVREGGNGFDALLIFLDKKILKLYESSDDFNFNEDIANIINLLITPGIVPRKTRNSTASFNKIIELDMCVALEKWLDIYIETQIENM
jgi:ankyrin repeat protein